MAKDLLLETARRLLLQRMGPVADLIIDDVLTRMNLHGKDMVASQYLKFLQLLSEELPDGIDKNVVIEALRAVVFRR